MFGIYSKETGVVVAGPLPTRDEAETSRSTYGVPSLYKVEPYDHARDDFKYDIAPGISVWASTIQESIATNGLVGDHGISLNVGERSDGTGEEPFLETNGGPRHITIEGGDCSCSIVDAAESLEMTPNELIEIVRKYIPQIDWTGL